MPSRANVEVGCVVDKKETLRNTTLRRIDKGFMLLARFSYARYNNRIVVFSIHPTRISTQKYLVSRSLGRSHLSAVLFCFTYVVRADKIET
jgi:hypothetical protein